MFRLTYGLTVYFQPGMRHEAALLHTDLDLGLAMSLRGKARKTSWQICQVSHQALQLQDVVAGFDLRSRLPA